MSPRKKKEAAAEDAAKAETDGDSAKPKSGKAPEPEAGAPKEEEKVDPNAAVKAEIKELEAAVRAAEKRHAAAQESIKERGKTGYLRLAAEVDNYRKRRNLDRDGLQRDAVVTALKSFIPVMEGFETAEDVLKLETETEQKFSSNYQALYRQLLDVCTKMGMTDYFGVQGENFNWARHEKVGEETSDEFKAGTIISCSSKGTEIKGSVVRKAKVVISLGAAAAAAAASEPEADAAAAVSPGDEESAIDTDAST